MEDFEPNQVKLNIVELKTINEEIARLKGVNSFENLENCDDLISNLSM